MTAAHFTAFENVDVVAWEHKVKGQPLGPSVALSFPDSSWDRVTIYQSYPTEEEARESGKSLAATLKPLCPKGSTGFYSTARLNLKTPACVAARETVEEIARKWKTERAIVVSVNGF